MRPWRYVVIVILNEMPCPNVREMFVFLRQACLLCLFAFHTFISAKSIQLLHSVINLLNYHTQKIGINLLVDQQHRL